jgi:hypothetical protein
MTPGTGGRRACRFARGRRAAAVLLLAVVAGLGVRLAVQRAYTPLASDSVHYVLLARTLAAGQGFISGGSQHPDLSRSPMLPLLTAAVSRASGLDALESGRLAVTLASALLVVPLFFLTRRLFGPPAALASLPLGAFSCTIGTAIHVMPAAPYLLFALGAIAAVWSAGRRPRPWRLATAGILAGAAAITRTEGVILALALAGWTAVGAGARWRSPAAPARRAGALRSGLARGAIVLSGAVLIYGPYAGWASWRLGRFSVAPGMEYIADMRAVCDRLSLRHMDGPDLPWAERTTFVVSADRTRRVLETWFDTRVLLQPAATFTGASAAPGSSVPAPGTPSLPGIAARRLRIAAESARGLPSALLDGHFLPPVPVALGVVGLAVALTRRRRRRAVLYLAAMAAVSLAPLLSHIESRFLYAPFVLGLPFAACGWGWIAVHLRAVRVGDGAVLGRALSAVVHVALAALVLASGLGHTDGTVEPLGREALHRAIAAEVANTAAGGPVLAVQMNVPFRAGCPYRPIPVGPLPVVLDYARAQGASCLVLEGDRDLERRPELAPLEQDPPPAGFRLELTRSTPRGGTLRVFRIERAK